MRYLGYIFAIGLLNRRWQNALIVLVQGFLHFQALTY